MLFTSGGKNRFLILISGEISLSSHLAIPRGGEINVSLLITQLFITNMGVKPELRQMLIYIKQALYDLTIREIF